MYSMSRVPYNKLFTNLASSSRTGEYWPSVVFVRTERSEVRTVTTSGQYSPVRPSRSVSKRLVSNLKRSRRVFANSAHSHVEQNNSDAVHFYLQSFKLELKGGLNVENGTFKILCKISFTLRLSY